MASAVVGALRVLLSADTAEFQKALAGADANVQKLANTMKRDLEPSQARVNSLVRSFLGSKEIGLAQDYAKAVEQIGGAAKLTANDQIKVNKSVQEALAHYKALGQEAPKDLIALANATKQVQKPTEELGVGMKTLMGTAQKLAGVFGVTLGAGALISFAKSAFDAADQIGDLALKMGVSVEAAQRFQFAARQSGAELEDVAKAVAHLNAGIGQGPESGVSKALAQMGFQFKQIRSLKPEDLFRTAADAIGKMTDPMQQSAAAAAVFGEKLGAVLLPMIRENSLKAADAIGVMSADTVKSLKDAKQAWENFGNALTVITGGGISQILKLIGALKDLTSHSQILTILAMAAVGPTNFAMLTNASAGMGGSAGSTNPLENLNTPGTMSSHGPHFETDAEREAREKADKERKARVKEILSEFLAPEAAKKRVEDLTAALKSVEVKDFDLSHLEKLREELDKLEKSGVKLGTTLQRFKLTAIDFANPSLFTRSVSAAVGSMFTPGLSNISFAGPGEFGFSGGLNEISGLLQAPSQSPLSSINFKRPGDFGFQGGFESITRMLQIPKQDSFRKLLTTGVGGLMGQMPQTILQAITGGGNARGALGALVGGGIGSSMMGKSAGGIFSNGFGKQFQGMFGNKVGGAIAGAAPAIASLGLSSIMSTGGGKGMMSNIGSYAAAGMMFGPYGAAIGAGVGAIVGAFKKAGNTTKQARAEFAKSIGFESLDNLYAKLKSLGAEGEKFANIGANVIGKHDKAADEKWMKDVTAFFDRLAKVPGKVDELTKALEKFGGVIPTELTPLLDSILGNGNLSADLKKQLEGMKTPSWQTAQDMASALGIDPAALGVGFNQSKLADQAFSLKRSLDLFGKFAGSDQNAILRDMSDEFSALAREAKRTGAALPKAIEAFVRQVDAMGLLVDENGVRIDSSLLEFKDIEDEYQKQVVSLLEQIRDLLTPPTSAPSPGVPGTPGTPGTPGPHLPPPGGIVDPTAPDFSMPSFGSMAAYSGASISGSALNGFTSNQTMTVILEQDGRSAARFIAPYLPGEVQRLRLAP